jgi:two-component system LytT family sensor kinase
MNDHATTPASTDEAYQRARRKVKAIKGFYIHGITYCVVIGALILIDFLTGRHWWFVWPAIGWGIGLAIHGFSVHGLDGVLGEDWEERKVKEMVERERGKAP